MTLILPKGLTLDNGQKPAAIAGVSPTLDYRFAREKREIETVSLTDRLTFTGDNQGTFVGSDGFIRRATTNIPRFTHDPMTRRSLGLLAEGQSANLLRWSEDFTKGLTPSNATLTADQGVAPSGALTADRFLETTANGLHVQEIVDNVFTAGVTYTFSCYAKTIGNRNFGPGFPTFFGSARFGFFDLTGSGSVVSANAGVTASIRSEGDGWYRCSITSTCGATGGGARIGVFIASGTSLTYSGDVTKGLLLWGAQLETQASATSYIPTTNATVTRTADSAVLDGTGVITGAYTMVEKPEGCAVISGTNINLQNGYTVERVMVFPAALTAGQITAIRGAM